METDMQRFKTSTFGDVDSKKSDTMQKLESSIPGLSSFPARDLKFKTPHSFLEGRRQIDGAEGLWRIGNNLYDLEGFARNHPGGQEWITLTKGTDITELFESHHLTDKASRLLPKYFIRKAVSPRTVSLTFKPDGFFYTFKRRALEVLKNVDFHRPSRKSNLIADFLATTTIILCLAVAHTQSYLLILAAGIFLAWTTIIGHNYFHMRDNFRMYYFDLSTMSSKEWRITHVMSHHVYPNTLWDFEVYVLEPYIQWLPNDKKTLLRSLISQIISPIIWALIFYEQAIKRYYSVFFVFKHFEFRDVVPLFIPILMSLFAPSFVTALKLWMLIIPVSSFVFAMVGFNAAHHHPDIFHDGDIYRKDLDWGLLELDAVRNRKVIDDSDFLVLTNFGLHGLHHLLPTVDHSYLPLVIKTFEETCKEFGIGTQKLTQWELIKGQFKQLLRKEPKDNSNKREDCLK
ncbi:Cytochrome b5-related protein [Anthophora plagiata]